MQYKAKVSAFLKRYQIFFRRYIMKKRIGLLATLAMCVTLGGVYATWTFAEGDIKSLDPIEETFSMGASAEVPKGILDIENNDLSFTIDDENGDHKAEIVPAGSITVSLTKNTDTSNGGAHCADISSVVITCTITVNGDAFKTTVTGSKLTSTAGATSWTIQAEDLGLVFQDTLDIQLDTQAEYSAFEAALSNDSVTLTFSAE